MSPSACEKKSGERRSLPLLDVGGATRRSLVGFGTASSLPLVRVSLCVIADIYTHVAGVASACARQTQGHTTNGRNWAGERCGSFSLHCKFAEENSGFFAPLAPPNGTHPVPFRNQVCGCPEEPTCILRPTRKHTNHAADKPSLHRRTSLDYIASTGSG